MEINPERLFRFKFKSTSMPDRLAYFVITDDIDKMNMFLKQHNFDPASVVIDCVPLKEHESDGEFMLRPYIIKSNSSDKEYKIMTTEHMVYECGEQIASMMSNLLIFGDAVIRDDLPIMKIISDLVYNLDHVYVLDHTLYDKSSKQLYSSAWEQYTKVGYPEVSVENRLTLQDTPASYDDSAIYESFSNSIGIDFPLPFTLEMYVSYFASLLTDEYPSEFH